MAVGLGGRHGGLAGTAAFRLPPDTDLDAHELIDASEVVTSQLDGSRGLPSLDRAAHRATMPDLDVLTDGITTSLNELAEVARVYGNLTRKGLPDGVLKRPGGGRAEMQARMAAERRALMGACTAPLTGSRQRSMMIRPKLVEDAIRRRR